MILNETRHESKTKLLNAALHVIRAKGYSAARIEDICEAAGLTKGSFFHHFDSKEALALAAADYWNEITGGLFASAPYRGHAETLIPDIEEAMAQRGMHPNWTEESLALYTQATIQGAFILAKARHSPEIAAQCIDHLHRYLELLFNQPRSQNRLSR